MKDRLLLLGVSNDTIHAINYAKEIGVHTIVTDYNDPAKCPEKLAADEYWMVDVKDFDTLEKKCREENITGVYAGNNEFCLDCVQKLTKRLGLPFYASDEGWLTTRDKQRFKEHCIAIGLDVPKRYPLEKPFDPNLLKQIEYPVVVKPVDGCASIGMVRCNNEEELRKGYDYAASLYPSGRVIVEDFIEGVEFASHFFVTDGKIHLTSFDTILYGDRVQGNNMCVTVNPSTLEKPFLDACQDKLQELCERLDIQFGQYYFEVMYARNKFYFLELIYRLDGVGIWSLTDKMFGNNAVKRLVNYALGMEEPALTEPWPDAKVGGIYFYWANPGTVARIEGRKEVEEIPGVEISNERYFVGDVIKDTGSMLQMCYFVSVVAEDCDAFIKKLKLVTDTLKLFDENGKELTVPTLPEEAIRKYCR